jgi:bisphosphoglycerate-independent phosphoglycerate mutase (AlkP superfamily)
MNRVALVILDGVGEAESSPGNAVVLADMKNLERIKDEGLTTLIKTSGSEVGLASEKDA